MSSAPFVYLEIDMPPSVNNLFVNVPGHGRIKSPKYRAWIEAAGWQIRSQIGAKSVNGPVGLVFKFVKQSKRRQDLDGRLKAGIDLLVSNSVIDDDSLVQRIQAEWVPEGAPCQIMVISTRAVEPIGEAA